MAEKSMPDGTEINPNEVTIIHMGPGQIKCDDKKIVIIHKDQ